MTEIVIDETLKKQLTDIREDLLATLGSVKTGAHDPDDKPIDRSLGFRSKQFNRLIGKRLDGAKPHTTLSQIYKFLSPETTPRDALVGFLNRGLDDDILLNWYQNRRASDDWNSACNSVGKIMGYSTPDLSNGTFSNGETEVNVAAENGWRFVNEDEFDPENHTETEAREYFEGNHLQPWSITVTDAVQRNQVIQDLNAAFGKGSAAVILHAATGQGKSTVVRQYAKQWLSKGPVIVVEDWAALADQTFISTATGVDSQTLIILDDVLIDAADEAASSQSRLKLDQRMSSALYRKTPKFLVATHSRNRRRWKRLFGKRGSELLLPNPTPDEAESIINAIDSFSLSQKGDTRSNIASLFYDGLENNPSSGLWPAMYQATRGEGLDSRMGRLVDEIRDDDGRFLALAGTVFINGVRDHSHTQRPAMNLKFVNSRLVQSMLRHLDAKQDILERAISDVPNMPDWFEREVIDNKLGNLTSDAILNLRHPAVSSSLRRWIFGVRAIESGNAIDQLEFFLPLAQALSDQESLHRSDRAVMAGDCLALLSIAERVVRGTNATKGTVGQFAKRANGEDTYIFSTISQLVEAAPSVNANQLAEALLWRGAASGKDDPDSAKVFIERCIAKARKPIVGAMAFNIAEVLEALDINLGETAKGVTRDAMYFRQKNLGF